MNIPFATFEGMHKAVRPEMMEAFEKVYDRGWFIQGEECQAFEEEFAAYNGAKYAIGVATGLDAIRLALEALGIGAGDEAVSYTHLNWCFDFPQAAAQFYSLSVKGKPV